MLKNLLNKKICVLVAAILLATFMLCGFADTVPSVGVPASPTEEGGTTDTDTDTPAPTPIQISANYFEDGKIIFSTLDVLTDMKDFNFTINFTEVTISSAKFGTDLQTGSYSVATSNADKTAIFTHGSSETAINGKVVLSTIMITPVDATLGADTVSFTDFTATNSEGTVITYSPTLTISAGPVVPELSEEEKAVYDSIIALPEAASLSFYDEEGNLVAIDTAIKSITDAKTAYDALTDSEKSNVNKNLEYDMYDTTKLGTLSTVADGMKAVYNVMMLADVLSDVSAEDLVKYHFICDKYDEIKESIDASKLAGATKALDEYNNAVTLLTDKGTTIDETWSGLDHNNKYKTLNEFEFNIIMSLSDSAFYSDFVDSIYNRATALRDDVDENFVGEEYFKDTLLGLIDDLIDKIELMNDGISTLPTFDLDDIRCNDNYTVTITRDASSAVEAEIEIAIYKESDSENKIDGKTFTFAEGKTKLEASFTAISGTYPSEKNVVVHVYYKISDATLHLGSKTVFCDESIPALDEEVGIPTTPSNKPSNNNNNKPISGGTIYPSGDVQDEDEDKPTDYEDEKLFNDIDNYGWAKEAIEGLYYAGIINGMEEGVFNPAGKVTREQFCKMAVQLFGVLEYETDTNFVDVDKDAWYAQYINSAIRAGYVQGQSDEYFGIGESIMRQDMATILFRGLGSQNSATELDFTDNDAIAPYAYTAISELVGLEILNGYEDGSFNPRGTTTRAEAAKVIWGVYQILNDK